MKLKIVFPVLLGALGLGYGLRDRWQVRGRSFTVPFHPGYRIDAYSGLYFEK